MFNFCKISFKTGTDDLLGERFGTYWLFCVLNLGAHFTEDYCISLSLIPSPSSNKKFHMFLQYIYELFLHPAKGVPSVKRAKETDWEKQVQTVGVHYREISSVRQNWQFLKISQLLIAVYWYIACRSDTDSDISKSKLGPSESEETCRSFSLIIRCSLACL